MKKIFLVFKTHFDIGFTDLASNVINQYATSMLEEVLTTCRSTEHMGNLKYVWTMPAWPLKVVCEQCSENIRPELEHYIHNGQIAWHALPFTSHTDFCGEEEYLESLRYAKELSDTYDKPYPVAAKMTDVPGHGLMLAELLSTSGIKFLHLGCNAFATPPQVPDLFFWEARSGKRVLTLYGKGGYGSSLIPPKGWKYPVWMALIHTHDNCGPHTVEYINELVDDAKHLYPDAEIVCGTMDDFYSELSTYDLSDVPVIRQDMADTWIHGIGSYPQQVSNIRNMRHESTRMQKLINQLELNNSDLKKIHTLFNSYYENMHLFGEHTWGADVKTWMNPNRVYEKKAFTKMLDQEDYKFMERSWQEQRERACNCKIQLKKIKEIIEDAGTSNWGLYNPQSFPYTGWISLELAPELEGMQIFINDQPVHGEYIHEKWSIYVENLSPLSKTELKQGLMIDHDSVLRIKKFGQHSSVENHRYRLEFDKNTGIIKKLYDKALHSVLLEDQNNHGIFSYQYTRHGIQKMTEYLRSFGFRFSDWGIRDYGRDNYPECEDKTFYPVFTSLFLHDNSISFHYRGGTSVKNYGNADEIIISITLPCAGDELFVSLQLKRKEKTPYIESGSFCMPLAREPEEYILEKQGQLLNPSTDITLCANHVFYALEDFVAADFENVGLCMIAPDTPLLSIGEDGIYTYRKEYEKKDPVLYFNLFNNMWGTNFPQWYGGDYTYNFTLFSYTKEEKNHLMNRVSKEQEGIELTKAMCSDFPLNISGNLQLLNIKQKVFSHILITRDTSGTAGTDSISLPGYNLREIDYYGRTKGPVSQEKLTFTRASFGLHIFEASPVTDTELENTIFARQFLPNLYIDKKEPFSIQGIGYTIFHKDGISPSSGRTITLDNHHSTTCVEYAIYYDFDIQHLYDLEHIWIYLDDSFEITGCETSFHGSYFNICENESKASLACNKLYIQPGKHAMVPDIKLFSLFIDYPLCCNIHAGKDGILNPEIFNNFPLFTDEDKKKTACYIKKHYSFTPSGSYQKLDIKSKLLMPWETLAEAIPKAVEKQLANIRIWG